MTLGHYHVQSWIAVTEFFGSTHSREMFPPSGELQSMQEKYVLTSSVASHLNLLKFDLNFCKNP